jgi:predicted ribosomally synthesized peptide with nif11-like leader
MTENMKVFLEKVSADEALAEKVKALGDIQDKKEAIAATIQLAEEAGCTLTEADFAQPSGELSDDDLDSVAGGAAFCMLFGGHCNNNGDTCAGNGWTDDCKLRCVAIGW